MKTSTILKRTGIGVLLSFLVLVIVLVVHIINVTPEPIDNATLQISRIDFENPISEDEEKQIKSELKLLTGVKSWRINREKGVLVFFHDYQELRAKDALVQIQQNTNLQAELFKLPAHLAQKEVCPIDRNGFAYQFSKGIQRIFK